MTELPARLAVLADVHGNLPALDAVLADAASAGVDRVVVLGDLVSGPLWPAETAARLAALGLPTLAGNHERQVLADDRAAMSPSDRFAAERLDAPARRYLAALPAALRLGDVYLCHGAPGDDLTMWLETVDPAAPLGVRAATAAEVAARPAPPPGVTLALCGHSHVPRLVAAGALTIVNPGSVGLPAWCDPATADAPAHGVEAGSPHARYAVVERAAGGWHVAHRAVRYAWDAAAARAAAGGRPDWAHALATGRNPA